MTAAQPECTCYLVDGEHVVRVEVISACPMHGHPPLLPTTRTVTVTGWLARYQVRQHLELHGVTFTEDRGDLSSTFTVEATDEQWVEINRYVQEVTP